MVVTFGGKQNIIKMPCTLILHNVINQCHINKNVLRTKSKQIGQINERSWSMKQPYFQYLSQTWDNRFILKLKTCLFN